MKKLILIVILLLFAVNIEANQLFNLLQGAKEKKSVLVVAPPVSTTTTSAASSTTTTTASVSCESEIQYNLDGGGGTNISDGTYSKVAGTFSPTETFCLCKAVATSRIEAGSPSGGLIMEIYTDDEETPPDNEPLALIATSDNTVSFASMSGDHTGYTYNFSTCITLTGSATYWMVLESTEINDTNNYARIRYDTADSFIIKRYSDSWGAAIDTSCQIENRLYKE